MPRHLKNLRIDEVSSVDRGAGHGVQVLLMKRDVSGVSPYTKIDKGDLTDAAYAYIKREFTQAQRDSAASSGAALPDGSFPIHNKSDLENAVHAIGRAKDPAKAKAHIKSRAGALGATDMLPDTWGKRKDDVAAKALELAIKSIVDDTKIVNKADALAECFADYETHINEESTMPLTDADITKLQTMIDTSVKKALEPVLKMTDEHKDYHGKLDGDEATKFAAMGHGERDQYMKKNPIAGAAENEDDEEGEDEEETKKMVKSLTAAGLTAEVAKAMATSIRKAKKKAKPGEDVEDEGEPNAGAKKRAVEIKKRDDVIAKLQKDLAVLSEKDQLVEFGKRASDIGLKAEGDGELLLKVHRGDPVAIKKLEERLKGLTEQVEKGQLFGEFGTRETQTGTAHDKIVAKADQLRKEHPELRLTAEQAYTKVLTEDRELATLEKRERDARINKQAA